jgi:hypothetical protein
LSKHGRLELLPSQGNGGPFFAGFVFWTSSAILPLNFAIERDFESCLEAIRPMCQIKRRADARAIAREIPARVYLAVPFAGVLCYIDMLSRFP